MKTIISAMFIGIFLMSCSKEKLTANGDKITETRTPGNFSGVNLSGSKNIQVTYGTDYKVDIKGSSNLIPYFKTKIIDDNLYLSYDKVSVQHDDLEVLVTLPQLRNASLSGSGKIQVSGAFPLIDKLKTSVSGSGEVIAQSVFEVKELLMNISGSGAINLEKILAQEADVDISGSGDGKINVREELKARISGSGTLYYTGSPEVDSKISGSGKVIKF
ncbi:head GIN domain-containing protein [Pedobacter caeni]|nr:head GIN domain-containing protein [Pedobacter caeni]